ncbi:hypothetical protein K438DRAFT_241284 [Mycena galopus ATCC 62051]|nr:hypothetical protein K438DRAFT_241284 [Mycena galopus ATCC 62051]
MPSGPRQTRCKPRSRHLFRVLLQLLPYCPPVSLILWLLQNWSRPPSTTKVLFSSRDESSFL